MTHPLLEAFDDSGKKVTENYISKAVSRPGTYGGVATIILSVDLEIRVCMQGLQHTLQVWRQVCLGNRTRLLEMRMQFMKRLRWHGELLHNLCKLLICVLASDSKRAEYSVERFCEIYHEQGN